MKNKLWKILLTTGVAATVLAGCDVSTNDTEPETEEVEEQGSVDGEGNVTISDLAGNTAKRYYKVSNIDKTAPVVNEVVYSPEVLTNTDVVVTIKLSEKVKEVEGWTLSENGSELSKKFTKNSKGNIEIFDLAGNKVVAEYNVKNIDKEAPKPHSTTYSPKTLTNGDVELILETSEDVIITNAISSKV